MYILIRASLVLNICSSVTWCRPYPRWYFTIFYFQCFPLAGLRLRFFWYVFPQDRKCLVASSVGGSLSFLVFSSASLTWPLSPATLSLYKFALSWLPFSRSAKSFPDRLFCRPGIRFPAPCFLRPGLITALSFWLRFLGRLFRRPLCPNQPCPTGYLGGRIALCTALLYSCVFAAPLWAGFLGALLFRRPPACCPPIFARFRAQPVVPARP